VVTADPLRRKVLRDVLQLRGQMLAIVLVMASGVALFVTLRGMYDYLRDAQEVYYTQYRFADVFVRARRFPLSVAQSVAALPGVESAQARIVFDVLLDVPGLAEPATGRLVSVPDRRMPMLNDLHLRSGRYVEWGTPGEVVINEAFAAANGLRVGSQFGAIVNGRWQTLRVVGTAISPEYVYSLRGAGDVFPDPRHFGILWMGEQTLASAFGMTGAANDLTCRLMTGASESDVIARVDTLLATHGGTGAYGRDDQLSHRMLTDEIAETEVTSIIMPAIYLAVTAFLLQMVLGRLVTSQRGQIGVLKAFGYTDRQIAGHYLELALVPILAGGIVGSATGLWLAARMAGVYARFFEFPPVLTYRPDWALIGAGLFVSVGAGLAGVIAAVRQAAALPPAVAMQPPSPPSFRPGLIERWGIDRHLSPVAALVVRSIERRPLRAALSALGTAFALALVVLGAFLFDTIDYAKTLQFQVVQREDAAIAFQDPLDSAVLLELGRFTGVRRVEPYRAVPVRLRHGRRTERTALLGLPVDGELHHITDGQGIRHRVPVSGLLLTTFLGDRLGVGAGDVVEVKALEGRRPVAEVPVAGLVDEVLGASAYMSDAAVSRLMNDGAAVSGAFLAVDPVAASSVYGRLKRLPAVTAVNVRQAQQAGFDQTLAESFQIPLRMLIVFACVIAAGLVYNGMSIAMAERYREIGTLRALGFSRGEVTRLMLAEQGLLTIIGLPVGAGLGILACLLVVARFSSEMFRLPLIVVPATYLTAAGLIVLAGACSALPVRRRIARLPLVEVLKLRE
jgi:putative ABC transport system permease protein